MARLKGSGGNVYVEQQIIEDCEDVWNELVDGDVTASLDNSDYKVGAGSNKFILAAGLGVGDIIATEAISSLDLSSYSLLLAWLKSTVTTAAGELQLLLDDTASCVSPVTTTDVPILTADIWRLCSMTETLTGATAIISVGLKHTVEIGPATVHIDHIVAAKAIAGIRSWSMDYVMNVEDTTGFDDSGHKTFAPTIDEWAGSFEGFKDGAPLTIGSVVLLEVRESATSTQQWRGNAILTGLHPNVPVDGIVAYSYDFQGTGVLDIASA